jgi:ferrous iron transport protein A
VTLAELEPGSSSVIEEIGGPRAFRRRLLELGLIPGTRVELLRRAPFGDPIELEARGSLLSIRRREAEYVRLEGGPAGLGRSPLSSTPAL